MMKIPVSVKFGLLAALVLVIGILPATALGSGVGSSERCTFVTQRVQCGELTCNSTTGRCVPCTADSQCYNGAYGCTDGKCMIRSLAANFKGQTILAPLCAIVVCSIAVIAGVGGGAILVPLFVAILEVPMSVAVGMSQATIVGQSTFNVFLQLRRHHPQFQPPNPTRPNINYEYMNLLLPISLAGSLVGSIGNKVAPDWFRVVLLLSLFSVILAQLIKRVRKQRAQDMSEKLAKEQGGAGAAAAPTANPSDEDGVEDDEEDGGERGSPDSPTSPPRVATAVTGINNADGDQSPVANGGAAEKQDKPQYPLGWIALTLFSFFALLGVSYSKRFIECGSVGYGLFIAFAVVYNIGLSLLAREFLKRKHRLICAGKLEPKYVPFKWNKKTTMLFPLIGIFAGGAATMLGIGGGLVFSFLLLEAGLVPEHASATGGIATLLVATESAIDFIFQKELRYDYGLMFFAAGIVSTCLGQFVFVAQIKKRGLTFLIVVALATIMGGSMVALSIFGIINTVDILHHDGSLAFGELCGP